MDSRKYRREIPIGWQSINTSFPLRASHGSLMISAGSSFKWPGNMTRGAKPGDKIFCAQRAWDHDSEVGFLKNFEDDFQLLAQSILDGLSGKLDLAQNHVVSAFYALWMARVEIRRRSQPDIDLKGIMSSRRRSKDQEEQLEKVGIGFHRGSIVPSRLINGMHVRIMVGRFLRQIAPTADWGILRASEGDFLVPDWPLHAYVPISPTIALANPAANQNLNGSKVSLVNDQLRRASRRYLFARDLDACP
jgi:hypothetical protein